MLDLLKKIGLPATIAAIIASLITLLPIVFKIDERYAKADELAEQIKKVEDDMNSLSIEIGKLAGTQQVLVSILSARVEQPRLATAPVDRPLITPVPVKTPHVTVEEKIELPTTPPVDAADMKSQLEIVSKSLMQTQQQTQNINRNYQTKR